MLPPRKVQFERRISIPQLQVRRALSGGYGGCLCQWELKAPTDRSQSDCVHEQVAKADCECPLYFLNFKPPDKLLLCGSRSFRIIRCLLFRRNYYRHTHVISGCIRNFYVICFMLIKISRCMEGNRVGTAEDRIA